MSAKDGFCMPNTTQTPDALFDDLMGVMGDPELRVTLHLVRQTFGWRREWSDPKHSTMPAIARATGLSEHGVRLGLRAGMKRGTIDRAAAPETRSYTYRLRVNAGQGKGSTRGRVPTVEGQRGAGLKVNAGQGKGSTRGRVHIEEHPLTPTNTHKGLRSGEPSEPRSRTRKRKSDAAADATPHPRNERFDAFCKAWAVNPDKPGNKAGLAQSFDSRCRDEGATVDEFREFYVAAKRSGEWGKFTKPHSTTDDFLAWRRKRRTVEDPFAGHDVSVDTLDPRAIFHGDGGEARLKPAYGVASEYELYDMDPEDQRTWPDWYAAAARAFGVKGLVQA